MTEEQVRKNLLIGTVLLFGVIIVVYGIYVLPELLTGRIKPLDYFKDYGDSYSAILSALTMLFLIVQMSDAQIDRRSMIEQAETDRKQTHELFVIDKKIEKLHLSLEYYRFIIPHFEAHYHPEFAEGNLKTLMAEVDVKQKYWRHLHIDDIRYIQKYYDDLALTVDRVYIHRDNAAKFHKDLITQLKINEKHVYKVYNGYLEM